MKKTSYWERTDLEKIRSQWKKVAGLQHREEWSAAIVRAATASEIAANLAIRKEFSGRSSFDPDFVDSLLIWANGLRGKMDRLLLPLTKLDSKKHKRMKDLLNFAKKINDKRNGIAHQGEFCNKKEASEVVAAARDFITSLVKLYEPDFVL